MQLESKNPQRGAAADPFSYLLFSIGYCGRSRPLRAFSLVEVVLAVGIFAFAMVAILGVFGATSNSTRAVLDNDILLSVWPAFRTEIRTSDAIDSAAITAVTDTTPLTLYLLREKKNDDTESTKISLGTPPTPTPGTQTDGRLYRAQAYLAENQDHRPGGSPLRVEVAVFPGDIGDTVDPLQKLTFHTVWNAR